MNYLIKKNVDAKIHYPVPIHLQPAAKFLKYKKGAFPIAENLAKLHYLFLYMNLYQKRCF